MKAKLKSLAVLWGISWAVLFLPYWGLNLMGFRPVGLLRFLFGAAAVGAAFGLLLHLDKETRTSNEEVQRLTVSGLIYELFVRRKPLLALVVLSVAGVVVGTYYVSVSLFTVEYTPESGVLIRLPGETVYYVPISPYGEREDFGGWQNTKIPVEEGDEITFELSGSVSPGFLGDLDKLQRNLRQVLDWENGGRKGPEPPKPNALAWDFTGPEGYPPEWYPGGQSPKPYIRVHFNKDTGLTVMGRPHNAVIATIVPPGGPRPRRAIGGKTPRPGYDWARPEDRALLIDLSGRDYPKTFRVKSSGCLWVEINDADDFRWDNVGFFFLQLRRHSGPFKKLEAACSQ